MSGQFIVSARDESTVIDLVCFLVWKVDESSFPKEVLQIRQEDLNGFKKPNCLSAPLPFSMGTFDHLEVRSFETRYLKRDAMLIVGFLFP